MDAWDDEFREPTEDERSARRAVALTVALFNARNSMTTKRIRSEFYPHMGDEAFRKAYQRDRKRLAAAGVSIIRDDLPTGDAAWTIDGAVTYADDKAITAEDALLLSCLLFPLASDPSFPYAHDLRLALAKLDRTFSGNPAPYIPPQSRARSRQLSSIEACLANHHAAHISYTRADGSQTQRDIVPWGLFPLRDTTYLVAPRIVGDDLDEPHVYNLNRMKSVRELTKHTYRVPDDFDVLEYVRLPFQLGDFQYEAAFLVPTPRLSDVRKSVADHGTWEDTPKGSVVRISVADEQVASTWAIAEGVVPLSPSSLVNTWRNRLSIAAEGVAR